MAYRNLLLHLDHTRACAGRIDAALALAVTHGAHIAALYCVGEIRVPAWADVRPELLEKRSARENEQVQAVIDRFIEKAQRAGVSYETRRTPVPVDDIADEVAVHARYVDLAILGQADPADPSAGGRSFPESVLLACGRPVMVVPFIGASTQGGEVVMGRRVLVAWDAGREATRAVNDALPLLERAEHVDLVAVNPLGSGRRQGADPGSDIALHLARHDVRVQVEHLEMRGADPGDTILALLSDRGSDLLVMGAYAHSRVREIVLGGVTRNVLEHMTVPVLMSH